jgi:hypothetical protein
VRHHRLVRRVAGGMVVADAARDRVGIRVRNVHPGVAEPHPFPPPNGRVDVVHHVVRDVCTGQRPVPGTSGTADALDAPPRVFHRRPDPVGAEARREIRGVQMRNTPDEATGYRNLDAALRPLGNARPESDLGSCVNVHRSDVGLEIMFGTGKGRSSSTPCTEAASPRPKRKSRPRAGASSSRTTMAGAEAR